MKNLALIITLATASISVDAAKSKQCKNGYQEVSCKEIKNAKRGSFCWKGKLSIKKKNKICKAKLRKKLTKK